MCLITVAHIAIHRLARGPAAAVSILDGIGVRTLWRGPRFAEESDEAIDGFGSDSTALCCRVTARPARERVEWAILSTQSDAKDR